MTRVLHVTPNAPEPDRIEIAARAIREGRLVAFPTETVYGLGANALDPAAVARIFEAKGRPPTDPLIAHIASPDQLRGLALDIPQLAIDLGERLWPGPLTLVLKRNPRLPANLSAGRDTVAVRQPAHPVAAALIRSAGTPIAAPSANLFSRPSPTTAEHVLRDLDGRIDLILDGGPTPVGVESTVLDLTVSPPAVLRPGGVPAEILREMIPTLDVSPRVAGPAESASSPGTFLKHYSPQSPLLLFTGPRDSMLAEMRRTAQQLLAENKRVAMLLATPEISLFADLPVITFDLGDDLDSVARRLFTGLRQLDSSGADLILAHDFPREGLGLAIWDRLFRAAEGRVVIGNW
ncbi:MAG: threonylcarbamoyl-AMP synthase [Chloroflexi bacterium]|nr:threonylcarbamoyl-AMP synthase [Chloroflexota bacterium]